jgi:hypothetical protein
MSQASILQRYTDDLLIGATATSSPAPVTSYSDATLLTHRPSARVRWDLPSPSVIDIHFALAASGRADVLVIPVWNVDAGSSVASLTSGSGMNVPIAVPTMPPSGIPKTTAVDLTVLETDAAKRTSNSFHLIITGNSVPLTMGGAVMLYGPKRELPDRDWQWNFVKRRIAKNSGPVVNDYGEDYVVNLEARLREIDVSILASDADAAEIDDWIDANFGNGLPGLLWVTPEEREAYFGRIQDTTESTPIFTDAVQRKLTFRELSKGEPVV